VLAEVDLMLAIPKSHRFADRAGEIEMSDLSDEDWVIYRRREGIGIFDDIMRVMNKRGVVPRIGAEVTRLIAAINLVAAGRGVTLVPATMANLHLEAVFYRPVAKRTFGPLPLTLAYRRNTRVRLVLNFVEATLKEVA
jgi:DNA-binding transcriptional LysR family regulator